MSCVGRNLVLIGSVLFGMTSSPLPVIYNKLKTILSIGIRPILCSSVTTASR